jgi:hypothetical protein
MKLECLVDPIATLEALRLHLQQTEAQLNETRRRLAQAEAKLAAAGAAQEPINLTPEMRVSGPPPAPPKSAPATADKDNFRFRPEAAE